MRPPNRVTVSESSDEEAWVYTPGGYNGPWKTPPYLKRPLDLLNSRLYQGISFIGPAQSGKTFGLVECPIVWNINHNQADMLVVQMSETTAGDFSKTRIKRLLNHSNIPAGELLKDNVFDKHFRSGCTLFVGYPAATQLSSKTLQIVLITDYDRMPKDIDGEGPGWDMAFNRIKTLGSRGKVVAECSPRGEALDPKEKLASDHFYHNVDYGLITVYHQGTRERWYWPCPECDEFFQCKPSFDKDYLFIPEHGSDLEEAAEQSRLICPHCGSLVDIHTHRREMNEHGVWVADGQTIDKHGQLHGEPPKTNIASFGLAGYAAQFQNPKSLILTYLQRLQSFQQNGDSSPLKTVYNTQLAAPYVSAESQDESEMEVVQGRAEKMQRAVVPYGVRFLTASVDVQGGKKKRFVVQVHGVGVGHETWIVDRFSITESNREDDEGNKLSIDPSSYLCDWDLITSEVVKRAYPLDDDSGYMPVLVTGIDTGGEEGVTDNAYEYFRELKKEGLHRRVVLFKGEGKGGPPFRKTYPDNTERKDRAAKARGDVPVYLLNTDRLKDSVMSMISRKQVGPRYVHFAKWLAKWFYEELFYETRENGKWKKPGKGANEAFDLFAYNYCLTLIKHVDNEGFWDKPPSWAQSWDKNSEIIKAHVNDDHDLKVDFEKKKRKPRQRRTRARF